MLTTVGEKPQKQEKDPSPPRARVIEGLGIREVALEFSED
jgi:hypothetical protein